MPWRIKRLSELRSSGGGNYNKGKAHHLVLEHLEISKVVVV
jgi:hypothetical protein